MPAWGGADRRYRNSVRAAFKSWATLRNDLTHQYVWAQGTPGGTLSDDAHRAQLHLRNYTTMVLLAVVGYPPVRLRSYPGAEHWLGRGQVSLDKP